MVLPCKETLIPIQLIGKVGVLADGLYKNLLHCLQCHYCSALSVKLNFLAPSKDFQCKL